MANIFAAFFFKPSARTDDEYLEIAEKLGTVAERRKEERAEEKKEVKKAPPKKKHPFFSESDDDEEPVKKKPPPKKQKKIIPDDSDDDFLDEGLKKKAVPKPVPKPKPKMKKIVSNLSDSDDDDDEKELIKRWQAPATGATDVDHRRFLVLVGVLLSPQTTHDVAKRGLMALRNAAKKQDHDLTPDFLARHDEAALSDLIHMVNYRNSKAKALKDLGINLKKNRCRVPTTEANYKLLRGIGNDLTGLLLLVNSVDVAKLWQDSSSKTTTTLQKKNPIVIDD